MDKISSSFSSDFFRTIDSENLPSVNEVLYHWNNLAQENLSGADWFAAVDGFLHLPPVDNNREREFFKKAIVRSNSFNAAYDALKDIDTPENTITALKFISRYGGFHKPMLYYKAAQDVLKPVLHELTSRDLSKILSSFGDGAFIPDHDFWTDFQRAWLGIQDEIEPKHMVAMQQAATKLTLKLDPALLQSFHDFLTTQGDSIDEELFDRAMWTAAVRDFLEGGTNLKEPVLELFSQFGLQNKITHNSVCSWFDLNAEEKISNSGNRRSRIENDLRDIFAAAGARLLPIEQRKVPWISAPVDIRAILGGRDIIVEVDGAHHFNRDTKGHIHYNGSTHFNSALKKKNAPESVILHIDFYSSRQLLESYAPDEQMRVAQSCLRAAYYQAPGNYHMATHAQYFRLLPMNPSSPHANTP